MNDHEFVEPAHITTVADLKQYTDGRHGNDWVLLINGQPVNKENITFGYPAEYGLWNDDDKDE